MKYLLRPWLAEFFFILISSGRRLLWKYLLSFDEIGVYWVLFPLCQLTDFKILLTAFQIKEWTSKNYVNPSLWLLWSRVGNCLTLGCAPQGSTSNLPLWLFSAPPPQPFFFFGQVMEFKTIRMGLWIKQGLAERTCGLKDYLSQPFFISALRVVQEPACLAVLR